MTNDIKNSSSSSYVAKVMLLCFSLLVALPLFTSVLLMSADAFASGTGNFVITAAGDSANETALSRVMCNVLSIVTGTAGKTFAAFAIVSVGIGFFTGKVSWGLMIGVAAGIAAIFGAPTIVAAISGGGSVNCDTQVFN